MFASVQGNRIRKLRRACGDMTGEELADRIGVSKGQVSKMERNKTSIAVADQLRLAEAFGVSVAWLMGDE